VSIESKQQEIIEEFGVFGDWMQKYEYIIELGRDLPLINDAHKTDDLLIRGCQSRVWLQAERTEEGNLHFTADSEAIITKGLVDPIVRVLDQEKPADIAQANLHFIKEIGLSEHLSPTRSNGLASMIKQMKTYGLAYMAQS